MGILPLELAAGDTLATLGLTGEEEFSLLGLEMGLFPGQSIFLEIFSEKKPTKKILLLSRLDTETEVTYYRHRGILPYVLRKTL